MKEYKIEGNDAGQRLDKYLHKLLPQAGTGFLYKMMRKKNITVNAQKVQGNEQLHPGDVVRVFFSDETFAKFAADADEIATEYDELKLLPLKGLAVLYEDGNMLALDKPANMLSQKAKESDVSANERMLGYLIREGALSLEEMRTFRPSVCNRLDRNTTGILLAGKTREGLQTLSAQLRSREVKKYYQALVAGRIEEPAHLKGYLLKDEQTNQVKLLQRATPGAHPVETTYRPLQLWEDRTLLELQLITGRSHQLRIHLASIGHPVIGDLKYGNPQVNEHYRKRYGVNHQLLHACRVELPGKPVIEAPFPEEFQKLLDEK